MTTVTDTPDLLALSSAEIEIFRLRVRELMVQGLRRGPASQMAFQELAARSARTRATAVVADV